MFSNFLYFLIALILFTSSDLFGSSQEAVPHALIYAGASFLAFALVCQRLFHRLGERAAALSHHGLDHGINRIISRLSVTALLLFALNIHGYHLRSLFSGILLFEKIPTLEALIFLGFFLAHLAVIWSTAYGVQKRFFPGNLTRGEFVISNISFALPALLPWFCLSLFADLVQLLPHGGVAKFLNTPAGEIGYIFLFLVAVAVLGPELIRRLWRCRPLEQGMAREKIQATCDRAGLKYADILRWELFGGSMITAGVMGLVGRFRYILVTPALLNSLEDDEVEAVILHEIGHVQKHHMIYYLLFFLGFVACNFVFFEPVMLLLYILQPLYDALAVVGLDKSIAHPLLIVFFLIASFVVYFRYGFGFLMRNCERQADLHLFGLGRDGTALISTFYKIASLSRQPLNKKNWHHFGLGERIHFLEQCRRSPGLIQAHHARVKKIVTAYGLGILVCFCLGYAVQYGPAQTRFGNFITEQILIQELEVDPENSDLYVAVGDYYYSREAYDKAAEAYENVIRIDKGNVHALNNLAWLLATCPAPEFRDAGRALILSARAVELNRAAFVLDTYAEALFVNNRLNEAVMAAREALSLATTKHDYYREQLERFQRGQGAI
ncbi:MAG: M48 family metalloprotease [Desulfobacterales bacterium]|nr:M48 family metalloprotease [Desulfobacterales bacterium]